MDNLTWVWRLSLGLGAIPPLSVFYFRIKMKEGDRYAESSMRHAKIPYWLVIKFYWSRLIPVAIIWFLYDFSSYSFGIYSSTILSRVIPDSVPSLKQPPSFRWLRFADLVCVAGVECRYSTVLFARIGFGGLGHGLPRPEKYPCNRGLSPGYLWLLHVWLLQ
jgi:hypothetical protein